MKKYLAIIALLIAFAAPNTIAAQITITIPDFPKIRKPKKEQPKQNEQTTTAADNEKPQKTESKTTTQNVLEDEPLNGTLAFMLGEVRKANEEVEKFNAEDSLYMLNIGLVEWLWRAVSPKERNKWFEQHKENLKPSGVQKFNRALDALDASAAKKLPTYVPDSKEFLVRNPAEERMMKSVLKEPARYKIYRIGLNQSAWLIDKNAVGIPTARYKHGMIYLRDLQSDHPYCYATFVNIIQDYAGGGTYAASRARFIKDELMGCPAEK